MSKILPLFMTRPAANPQGAPNPKASTETSKSPAADSQPNKRRKHTRDPRKETASMPSSSQSDRFTRSCVCETFVSAKDIKEWKARPLSEQRAALKKASAELILFNLSHEKLMDDAEARLADLEKDNINLKKQFSVKAKALEADKAAAVARSTALEKEKKKVLADLADVTQERDNLLSDLDAKDASHEAAMDVLKTNLACEKKEAEDASYEAGVRGYLIGFLATDPAYDWASKYDAAMVSWIEDFKVKEAAAIGEKRASLEQEGAAKEVPEKVVTPPIDQAKNDETQDAPSPKP